MAVEWGAHLVTNGISAVARVIGRVFNALACRPFIAGSCVAMTALLLAAAASAAHGFPLPRVHDEFSYLLGAETFASGRLTNPTHPMWRYFQTFHVIQHPTYNSKYPPASALFIAAGWKLAGRPIAGVWLSFAFMCVAIYWMLRAWIGADWALRISLASTSWIAASYWTYSYWGGAVAAGAGAVMLGALYRVVSGQTRLGNAILLGVGLVLLANSRPYEGGLLALSAAVVFLRWLWRDRQVTWRRKWANVLLPLLLVGGIGMACMSAYNGAVTGRWYEMPYSLYQETYNGTPLFLWQRPVAITTVADTATNREFDSWNNSLFRSARTPAGRLSYVRSLRTQLLTFIVPIGLALPFLLVPFAIRAWWTRFSLITIVWMVCGMGLPTFFHTHYAAPLIGLLLFLYGDCLRLLSTLRVGSRAVGNKLALAVVVLWFAAGVASTVRQLISTRQSSWQAQFASEWTQQRQLIADTLSRGGRRNLIVVRYGSAHSAGSEWVYNAANIDASAVVWARDMGDLGNRPLLKYFKDRAAWLIEVDNDNGPMRVSPYRPFVPKTEDSGTQ